MQVVVAKNSAATATKTMSYMEEPRWVVSEPLGPDQCVEQVGEQREQQQAAEDDHGGAARAGIGRMAKGLSIREASSVGRSD